MNAEEKRPTVARWQSESAIRQDGSQADFDRRIKTTLYDGPLDPESLADLWRKVLRSDRGPPCCRTQNASIEVEPVAGWTPCLKFETTHVVIKVEGRAFCRKCMAVQGFSFYCHATVENLTATGKDLPRL